MNVRRSLLVSGALLAIAVGGYRLASFIGIKADSTDLPEGTFWVCLEQKHEFVHSLEQLAAVYAAGNGAPPCPLCQSQNTTRALRCTHQACRHFFLEPVVLDGHPSCPTCRRPLKLQQK